MSINPIIIIAILLILCMQKDSVQALGGNQQEKTLKQTKDNILEIKVKEFSSGNQMCGGQTCQFQYYVFDNSTIQASRNRNFTILVISGLRGNDEIGPQLLQRSLKILNAARIIYVPVVNPSGFSKKQKNTFPGNIDVETDFPLIGAQSCNQTGGFKLLTKLFNTYEIDLSIYVHSGQPTMSYSWNNHYNLSKVPPQAGMLKDIADLLKYQHELNEFSIDDTFHYGSQMKVKEDNSGDFVDWAYGAMKNPSILKQKCNNEPVNRDLFKKMNGISFSLGLGQPHSSQVQDLQKYIKRGQMMLEKTLEITNPKIQIQQEKDQLIITLQGCKIGTMIKLTILNNKNETVFVKYGNITLHGNIRYGQPQKNAIKLENIKLQGQNSFVIEYQCDNGWINFGQSKFGNKRLLEQKGTIINLIQNQNSKISKETPQKEKYEKKVEKVEKDKKPQKLNPQKPQNKKDEKTHVQQNNSWFKLEWNIYTMVLAGFILCFFVMWFISGVVMCIKILRMQKIRNFNEKFENIEYVQQDTFQYDSSAPRYNSQTPHNKMQLSQYNFEGQKLQPQK